MRFPGKALALVLPMWGVPFVIGMISHPMRELWRALFESIMSLSLTVIAVVCTSIYFRNVEDNHLREGFGIGLLWLASSILLDIPFFMTGPMKMTLREYAADIGLTYVMIPAITIGFGVALENFHLHRK